MQYRSRMSSERDVVDELWRLNPLLTLRHFFGQDVGYFVRKLRHAMVRARRGEASGPMSLPEGIDEAEIIAALRDAHAASLHHEQIVRRLSAQTGKLGLEPHDEHLEFVDKVRASFEQELASIELLTLALEFELATEADKQRFASARAAIERRLAEYFLARDEPVWSWTTGMDELLSRLVGRRRRSLRRFFKGRSRSNPDMSIVDAVHRALVLERAAGAGITIEEADAQDRARWV